MDSTRKRNPSLWIETSSSAPFESLQGDRRCDVVVVGAGIAGLSTARLLIASGMSVVVIEAGEVCSGVTGYTTAKVTSLHAAIYTRLVETWGSERAAVYATANEAAVAKVRDLVGGDRIDCDLEEGSAYTYTEEIDGVAAVEREAESAREAGLPSAVTTDTDLPYPVQAAVRVDGQAQLHPRKYCLGLGDAILRSGGSVFEHTRARRIDARAGRVITDEGVITADAIVLATHIPISDAGGHFARMEPKRSYAGAFQLEQRPRGMYISIDEPTRSVRSTADGWVIVGGEGHKVGHDDDTIRRYDALERFAAERFGVPGLHYRWSAQDYVSADALPYVGRLRPGGERVFVATGFGKWGMTNGTVAAMILTDLIRDVPNPWADTFDSTRLAVRQGAKRLLRENLEVAKRFLGDRVTNLHPPNVSSLTPGEGAIASLNGNRVAAYRDEDGALHCVAATCTHLGCQVTFNTAERTWDCPCHGSRFDIEGRVVQGPAVDDLAREEG